MDDLSTGSRQNLPGAAAFYHVDIRSPELRRVFVERRPEVVFHLAAQIDVRRSVSDPVADASVNVLGTIHVLELCREFKINKVVFASTGGALYGDGCSLPTPEREHPAPLTPYGAGKLAAEGYLAMVQRSHGVPTVSLRCANVYGPRQDPHGEAGVVAIFGTRLLNDQPVTIFGDGSQTRDFIYVEDVVRANLQVVDQAVSGVFNLGTGVETSIRDLHRHMAAIAGNPTLPILAPRRPGEQARSALDSSRLTQVCGWAPQVELADGLRRTLAYFGDRTSGRGQRM